MNYNIKVIFHLIILKLVLSLF